MTASYRTIWKKYNYPLIVLFTYLRFLSGTLASLQTRSRTFQLTFNLERFGVARNGVTCREIKRFPARFNFINDVAPWNILLSSVLIWFFDKSNSINDECNLSKFLGSPVKWFLANFNVVSAGIASNVPSWME